MRRLACVSALSALAALVAAVPSLASAAPGAAATAAGKQPTAVGTGGGAASMDLNASEAAISVLKRGGNAIDAAVAAAATMGVTIPFVAGPGGGGFMVIYLAKTHQVVTINGRETCPAACTTAMFINHKTGKPMNYFFASDQPRATGVPSMVATWAKAVSRYGRLSLADDLQPAISVADRGFRINADWRQLEESDLPELRAYSASRKLFLTPAGNPLPVGSVLRNPDLANTYRLLASHGPSYLYGGPLGRAIVRADDHPALAPGGSKIVRLRGIMTMSDLRAYRARIQAPTHVSYRGLDIYGMAPPSSSGTTVGEALNIMSGWNLSAEPRATAMFHYLEASRLAYADRDAWVGDPRYVGVPVHSLLDPKFAATRRCLVHHKALTSPVAPGDPFPPYQKCQTADTPAASVNEGMHTNNIVTVDKWGDVVGYTNTINFFGGSGETVPGYGFLLNDEMTDFDFTPPAPGAYDPNLPAGGKQPRSSMGPAIALRDGKPAFAVGAAGGATIITTILEIIMNHVDFGMSLPAALAAPRVSQTNSPTSLAEPAFYRSALAKELTSKFGEQFTLATGPILPLDHYPGDATGLAFLPHGLIQTVAEPVRLGGGSALVVHPAR
jgi:gamma-glutamyltranspeptidase/glutathione hydrolase